MTDNAAPCCRRFRIAGRVQGVFFRASTRDVAVQLALTGYAKNMPDGSVEVLACGTTAAIDRLAAWLEHGPRMAIVHSVHAETVAYRHFDRFATA